VGNANIFLGYVHPGFVRGEFPLQVANMLLQPENRITAVFAGSSPSNARARNSVIAAFLSGNEEWLLWMDDDATVLPDAPHKLRRHAVAYEAKMAASLAVGYDKTKRDVFLGAWNFDGKGWTPLQKLSMEPQWVDGVGCHFTLVHRDVYLTMKPPYHLDFDPHPLTGEGMGHDLAFCLKRLPARVLVVPAVRTGHIKEWEITLKEWESAQS